MDSSRPFVAAVSSVLFQVCSPVANINRTLINRAIKVPNLSSTFASFEEKVYPASISYSIYIQSFERSAVSPGAVALGGLTNETNLPPELKRKTSSRLALTALLIAVKEVVALLLAGPLGVQREDDERRQKGGPDEAVVVNAKRAASALGGKGSHGCDKGHQCSGHKEFGCV
jgi:hypothetical protein